MSAAKHGVFSSIPQKQQANKNERSPTEPKRPHLFGLAVLFGAPRVELQFFDFGLRVRVETHIAVQFGLEVVHVGCRGLCARVGGRSEKGVGCNEYGQTI